MPPFTIEKLPKLSESVKPVTELKRSKLNVEVELLESALKVTPEIFSRNPVDGFKVKLW